MFSLRYLFFCNPDHDPRTKEELSQTLGQLRDMDIYVRIHSDEEVGLERQNLTVRGDHLLNYRLHSKS